MEKQESKKWYQSKSIWAGIISVAIALVNLAASMGLIDPAIAVKVTGFIGVAAGSFGIYGRCVADETIGGRVPPGEKKIAKAIETLKKLP